MTFKQYMAKVLSQLECNMSEEDKKQYVCFLYTPQQIEKYRDKYFRKCWRQSMGAYTALTLFSDYLNQISV